MEVTRLTYKMLNAFWWAKRDVLLFSNTLSFEETQLLPSQPAALILETSVVSKSPEILLNKGCGNISIENSFKHCSLFSDRPSNAVSWVTNFGQGKLEIEL